MHALVPVRVCMRAGVCVAVGVVMGAGMCVDMCVGMCGLCADVYVDLCADMYVDLRADMCVDLCADMGAYTSRHVAHTFQGPATAVRTQALSHSPHTCTPVHTLTHPCTHSSQCAVASAERHIIVITTC